MSRSRGSSDGLCLSRRSLGRQFVFSCRRFQLFELKLYLLQEPRLALRAAAVNLATQLLNLELEVADECLSASASFALAASALALAATASASRCAVRSARIIACAAARQWGAIQASSDDDGNHIHHDPRSSKPHPTDVGRHVSCGCLQSIPDKR